MVYNLAFFQAPYNKYQVRKVSLYMTMGRGELVLIEFPLWGGGGGGEGGTN